MWFAGLPSAFAPSWQDAHPDVIPAWVKDAPAKLAKFEWQVSHGAPVEMWLAGFPAASVPLWQAAHVRGVPFKRALT